jgi:lipopolysaccharide/colanic/teichoic acid biosynthesis glycosyltransferase
MPVFLVVSVLILLTDGRPILFKQTRVGLFEKEFTLFKFRSMRNMPGPLVSQTHDSRITKIGAILRKTKLDELPQLLNVMRGDMSFVGPRPEVPLYTQHYTADQKRVFDVRPGITDPASIQFRNEAALLEGVADMEKFYIEEILPQKLELSLDYTYRKSFLFDLRILFQTVLVVVTK